MLTMGTRTRAQDLDLLHRIVSAAHSLAQANRDFRYVPERFADGIADGRLRAACSNVTGPTITGSDGFYEKVEGQGCIYGQAYREVGIHSTYVGGDSSSITRALASLGLTATVRSLHPVMDGVEYDMETLLQGVQGSQDGGDPWGDVEPRLKIALDTIEAAQQDA